MKKQEFFQNRIISWGKGNLRDFFWRRTENPYEALVSEIFLIRTKAENVERLIKGFIERFPNYRALNKASQQEVVKAMDNSGLQNQKAENFKAMAITLEETFGGRIPSNYKDLITLRGVGKYTANAILCFHFNQKTALIDGNFIRIFERFFNIKSEKKEKRDDKRFWNLAERLLPDDDYQLYNYSVLDFCSLVCKTKPLCEDCILNMKCSFFNQEKNYIKNVI